MTRISAGLSGIDLTALQNLNRAFEQISEAGLKLSTLRRINRGSDDPAGLIAAEELRSELSALEAATRNNARTTAAVDRADTAFAQVADILNSVRDNVLESAGGNLSPEEEAANQLEIDAALEALDRIGAYAGLSDTSTISAAPTGNVNDQTSIELPALSAARLGTTAGRLNELASGGAHPWPAGTP